jgi:hypothetical protein
MSLPLCLRCLALIATVFILAAAPASAEDVRKACYAIRAQRPFNVSADILRQAAHDKIVEVIQQDKEISPSAPPAELKKCTPGSLGAGPPGGIPSPDKTNYYGNFTTRLAFRRFSQMACNGVALTMHRFFSMGDALFYRQCTGGNEVGFVYFWGLSNGKQSDCLAYDYPGMFAIADADKKHPVTLAQMAQTYSGGLAGTSSAVNALKNAMAAILISESYRDVLAIAENYMLMDVPKVTPAVIIGGHCPQNLGAQASACENARAPKDGLHPLAWGGAQAVMMANRAWGYQAGATSDFGKAFEANMIAAWLVNKKSGVTKAAATTCDPNRAYRLYPPDQHTAIEDFFADLLPAK